MREYKESEQWLKRGIVSGLAILFLLSVFVLADARYGFIDRMLAGRAEDLESIRVISNDTLWDYMDGGFEPGIGNVWTTHQYDSSFWKKEAGIFDAWPEERDTGALHQVELISQNDAGENVPTYFFRKTFQVENLQNLSSIRGSIHFSDAAIVYLNGEIIFAGNAPAGGYRSNQETRVAEYKKGVQSEDFTVTDLSALKEGENILSVEIHQGSLEETDAYFFFEYMDLSSTELEEESPDVQTLILETAENETGMGINWLTSSPDFYKVEYMEAAEFKEEDLFSEHAKSVLMGRNTVWEEQSYVNYTVLPRLKADTDYVYRVIKVGGKAGSEIMQFHTAKRKEFSFALFGDPQLGAYENNDFERWNISVEKAFACIGKTDFILSLGDQVDGIGEEDFILKCFSDFRSPLLFKEIPVITVKGNHEAHGTSEDIYERQFVFQNRNEQGDYWFTCQDVLFVILDSNEDDYSEHRQFVETAISEAVRKWVIVAMHHSIFSGGEHAKDNSVSEMRAEYAEMFAELDVDLVLGGHDHIYSRSHLMAGELPLPDKEDGRKEKGETLYITASSSSGNKFYSSDESSAYEYTAFAYKESDACITRVDVEGGEIRIETYRIEDGIKIDSCLLTK